jgi:hypothetical protein
MSILTQGATDLLDILTILDPDAVPVQLFRRHGHAATFSRYLGDAARYCDSTERLADQSLIEVNLHENTFPSPILPRSDLSPTKSADK